MQHYTRNKIAYTNLKKQFDNYAKQIGGFNPCDESDDTYFLPTIKKLLKPINFLILIKTLILMLLRMK